MAAEPCKVCGHLRKIDIIMASDGWHQPQCYNCGDPGYIEHIENYRINPDIVVKQEPIYIWPEDRPVHLDFSELNIDQGTVDYPTATLNYIRDYLKEHDPEVLDALYYDRES